MTVVDVVSQFLITSPFWLQGLIMFVVVVPLCAALAMVWLRHHVPGSNMASVSSVAFGCFATPNGGGWSLGYLYCRSACHDKIVCNVIIAWVGEASCCGFL